MKHPKIIEACEFLMDSKIFGVQTWAYFKPPGQLGRDLHQNIFYTQCNSNEKINNLSQNKKRMHGLYSVQRIMYYYKYSICA